MPNNLSFSLYLPSLLALIITGLSIWLIYSYLKLLRHYQSLKTDTSNLTNSVDVKTQKLWQEAQKEAHQIIAAAQANAAKIISDTQIISQEAKDRLDAELARITFEQTSQYQRVLTDLRTEVREAVTRLMKESHQQAIAETEAFHQSLKEEVARSRETVKTALTTFAKGLEDEIELYRQQRLQAIDKNIFELVDSVTRRTLNKVLTKEEHEQIVIDALETAKKEGFF
ncbi:hypothetical protein A2783_04215 [Microgenomates group bacterium RIFCSPHIGHO2_01_FULL_45_11]|nr:MAG: hypothetical protein A2783_04215 [Microgenomates group bacterium RIFCSPHIGHO2_01_FULL_45_11]